jgi:hypothetical protein
VDRIKSYDDDDMNNFAFEKADEEVESDEKLLDEWSTEGPDEAPPATVEDEDAPAKEEEEAETDPYAVDADEDENEDGGDSAGEDSDDEEEEETW